MNAVNTLLLLISLCTVIYGQWILEKLVEGPIDKDDDYWVVKINNPVNRPAFPAYIRFYNTRKEKSELDIDCSTSQLILYNGYEIIFRTTGHLWTDDDSYYVTLDEGVLYSDNIKNSTEFSGPKFWQFNVIRARDF